MIIVYYLAIILPVFIIFYVGVAWIGELHYINDFVEILTILLAIVVFLLVFSAMTYSIVWGLQHLGFPKQ